MNPLVKLLVGALSLTGGIVVGGSVGLMLATVISDLVQDSDSKYVLFGFCWVLGIGMAWIVTRWLFGWAYKPQ